MCHTTVTIEGETLEMWLPVMDGANKSMKKQSYTYSTKYGDKTVDAATTFDINKTIMRCLVKNLAMFGLGIYIYAGEDLPENDNAPAPAPAPVKNTPAPATAPAELEELKKGTENWDKIIKYVTANKHLGMEKIGQQLNRKYKISTALKKEIANLLTDTNNG
jgi:NH3-dependent NAD+ synthetase